MTVQLIAGMIEGDAAFASEQSQEDIKSNTKFRIYGTLKKTVFATSFNGLANLIQELKADPDSFLSRVPQDLCLSFMNFAKCDGYLRLSDQMTTFHKIPWKSSFLKHFILRRIIFSRDGKS